MVYKTLPNEDGEQKRARLAKDFRNAVVSSAAIDGIIIKQEDLIGSENAIKEEIISGGLPELTKSDLIKKRNNPLGKILFKKKGKK